jgi:DNA damage-binding protein 1
MISLYCKSLAGLRRPSKGGSSSGKQLAIVGDLMRSISLVEYLPKHQVIEELARDYNANFCTSIEMLTDNVYLGSENFANLFVLRHNVDASSEEARVRLDTIGEYHFGEMINTMQLGSLVMPSNAGKNASAKSNAKSKTEKISFEGNKIEVAVGSQTLFGTVDGTIGSILGLGGSTYAFLGCLQRAIFAVVRPVGDLSYERHRYYEADGRIRPSRGFIDGDLIESFLDFNRPTMERIVTWMNDDGRWRIRDDGSGRSGQSHQNPMDPDEGETIDSTARSNLSVEDVLIAVEEIIMLH